MQNYDVFVVGGGPGGYLAAERAGQEGLSVGLAELGALGGVCLNEGCVPTKTLLNSAKLYSHAKKSAAFGVTAQEVSFDHNKVIDRKNTVVKQLVAGVTAKMSHHGVTVYDSMATVTGVQDGLYTVTVGEHSVTAKNIIFATGSKPAVPPIEGMSDAISTGFALTSREMLNERDLPEHLCVIGGGVIGVEFAAYYATIGVKVTVVEMLDKIGGAIDEEIAALLQKNCRKKGVTFKLGCKVTELGEGFVAIEEKGEQKKIECDRVLLSVGRVPVHQGSGAAELGVAIERNAITVDDSLRTNLPGVYAVGDCNGKMMLAHTAYREAEVAVNNIMGKTDAVNYNAIPSVIYTDPEVAMCGMTLEQAQQSGIDAKCLNISLRYSGRYIAETSGGDGICKLIVDTQSNTLVGVHMIGGAASEMIYGVAMMIGMSVNIDEIKKAVFPHPTVSEVIREGLYL